MNRRAPDGAKDSDAEPASPDTRVTANEAHAETSPHVRVAAKDPDAKPGRAPPPRWLVWLTRLSLVIGLVALVATVWIIEPATIFGHLRAIGWFFLILVACELLSAVLDGIAAYYMAYGPGRPTVRESIIALLAGRGVNAVTPGGNLGEATKVGLLAKRCSPRRAVAAVMYTGLVGVVVNLAVIAIGSVVTAFWFDVPVPGQIALLAGAAIAATTAVVIIVLIRHGMLTTLTSGLERLHLISATRRDRWNASLAEVDERLRGGDDGRPNRRRAIACIVVSRGVQKVMTYFTVLLAGYALSPGQLLALLSAGVLLHWVSTLVPMGLGISEGGSAALFVVIGAPASLGIAYALARRVNQIVFAVIGFITLALDRLGRRVRGDLTSRLKTAR